MTSATTSTSPAAGGEPQRVAGLARARIKARGAAPLGPHTHLAETRERLAAMTWERFDLAPASATIGAEIGGIDVGADLDETTIADLRRALLAHKVLVFRDQDLTGERQLAFARRFGELEVHPFLAGSPEAPELVHLAKDAAVGGYENIWHADVTWREQPALGAVLRAIDVPAVGGDTLWADMAAAYQGLEPEVRARIDDRRAVHDFTLSFGQVMDETQRAEARRTFPPAEHPVVRTHPETGERVLFVNAIFTSHVVGMDEDESEALLDHLFRQAEIPEHQFRLRWAPGTVAFWDNRATQHYASSDYWPEPRVMERAAIAGDRPF